MGACGPSHPLFSCGYCVSLLNALPTSVFSSGFPLSPSLFWLPSIQNFPLKTLKEHTPLCSEPSNAFRLAQQPGSRFLRRPVRPCRLCPYHPSALTTPLPSSPVCPSVPPDPAIPAALMIFECHLLDCSEPKELLSTSAWNSLFLNESGA